MSDLFSKKARSLAKWTERAFSIFILIGIVFFTYNSIISMAGMDWSMNETFYEMIDRTLLIVIAIELIRTLITHDLHVILELLAIVIARKLLKPDLQNLDIVLSVTAFAGLLAARKWLLQSEEEERF